MGTGVQALPGIAGGISSLSWQAYALWGLGYPEQALKRVSEALTLAQECSHPFSLEYARGCATRLHQFRREGQAAQTQAETLLRHATEQGFALRLAQGSFFRGWALAVQGRGTEGIPLLREGLAAFQATGAAFLLPCNLAMLVEAYAQVGQPEEGLNVLTEALAAVNATGERFYEAELYRLTGELTLQKLNDPGSTFKGGKEAEECFQKALNVARGQSAKSLELRAATSLARLWQSQGKETEARDLLAPVYDWFTEGFDTADLKDAKALLDMLGKSG